MPPLRRSTRVSHTGHGPTLARSGWHHRHRRAASGGLAPAGPVSVQVRTGVLTERSCGTAPRGVDPRCAAPPVLLPSRVPRARHRRPFRTCGARHHARSVAPPAELARLRAPPGRAGGLHVGVLPLQQRRRRGSSRVSPLGAVSVATRPVVRDVLLRDGSTLRLRAPGPEDLDDLKAFYEPALAREPLLALPRLRARRRGGGGLRERRRRRPGGPDRPAGRSRRGGCRLRRPARARRRRGGVRGRGRLPGTRRRDADARAARGDRGRARDPSLRRRGDAGQPGDAERLRAGGLRRAARERIRRAHRVAGHQPRRGRARAHRRARPPRRGGLAATDPRSRLGRGRGRVERAGQPGRRGPGQHPRRRVPRGGHARRPAPAASCAPCAWRAAWPSSTSRRSSWSSRSPRTTSPTSPPKRRNTARRRC